MKLITNTFLSRNPSIMHQPSTGKSYHSGGGGGGGDGLTHVKFSPTLLNCCPLSESRMGATLPAARSGARQRTLPCRWSNEASTVSASAPDPSPLPSSSPKVGPKRHA